MIYKVNNYSKNKGEEIVEEITFIKYSHETEHLDKIPDYCPLCNNSVIPKLILLHQKDNLVEELLCKCPNGECNSLFIVVYSIIEPQGFRFETDYRLKEYYPQSRIYKKFPDEIIHLSSKFKEIYNQAHHAEQEGLDLICGVAYRKSLEYLLKDYIISENPEEEEKVKAIHSIQSCINDYIGDSEIKDMAERATWLGNDETHYIRKWDDKDINDLKNLIDLTVYFISMKLKAKKYKEEMEK